MEEKFYLDDFELSLQEQANQFKMVPAKKVWQGIYNDIHPGRRWPSVMVSLILIFSILFVGYINNSTNKIADTKNLPTPVKGNEKDFPKLGIMDEPNPLSTRSIDSKNDKYSPLEQRTSNKETTSFEKLDKTNISIYRNILNDKNDQPGNRISKNKTKDIKTRSSLPVTAINQSSYSLNNKNNTVAENKIGDQNPVTKNNEKIVNYPTDIFFEASDLKSLQVQNSYISLSTNVPESISTNSVNNNLQLNSKNGLNQSDKAVLATAKKRNEKISWVYYAGPYVSTVSFSGGTSKESINSTLSSSPSPQVAQKDMTVLRKAAFGLGAGIQLNYALTSKLILTSGVHVTRSGYNIISNLVHPTLATLTLRSTLNGEVYSRDFVTHYGDGTGKSTVTLNNYSYKASIPLGVEYVVWHNDNLQINLATDFEPSFIFKSDAYLPASYGKNYVNVPDLIRKWNFSSNFSPFVRFTSSKFKWSIGPDIRYQWLSTYQRNYTIKEHLIDYGIRVGISK